VPLGAQKETSEADQSTHGRMRLLAARKEENRRRNGIAIESYGAKSYVFGLRKAAYSQQNSTEG
jgi:hypothetical protein